MELGAKVRFLKPIASSSARTMGMTASPLRRWWWKEMVMPSVRPDFSIAARREAARLSRQGIAARIVRGFV